MPSPPADADLLVPLTSIRNTELPQVSRVDPARMPELDRTLLAHHRDMTPTLTAHHGCPMQLRVLTRRKDGDTLLREIVLLRERDRKPVEYGAIRIFLNRFDDEPRALIESGKMPFGAVLARFGIAHSGAPHAYLKVQTNRWLERCLELPAGPFVAYGRRNVLRMADGTPLADVLEILPPVFKEKDNGSQP